MPDNAVDLSGVYKQNSESEKMEKCEIMDENGKPITAMVPSKEVDNWFFVQSEAIAARKLEKADLDAESLFEQYEECPDEQHAQGEKEWEEWAQNNMPGKTIATGITTDTK